jgi:hypothetical protein
MQHYSTQHSLKTPVPRASDESTCLHCGYLDVPQYQDEIAICPGCGSVRADVPSEPTTWLSQWPANRRSTLANLFYAVIRRGETFPPAIIEAVMADIYRRLQWTSDFEKRQWWSQVLNTLQDDPHAAQAYAETVCAIEALPAAEKAARKAERAKTFMATAMRGKPVTEKQLGLLRSKGYTGEIPQDRASASELIDRLLCGKGGL